MAWVPQPDLNVRYRAYAFPAYTVPSAGVLTFTTDDLAHALFVTGRAPGDRGAHGKTSVYEWLHRTSLVPAYLRRTYRAGLVKSNLALELDRSEKVALSYALGQAMTGIFCGDALRVRYLMHVDRYATQFGVQFGPGRRRADLFGLAPNGWVVAEAKGRSGGVPRDLRDKVVDQKRTVRAINGQPPWLAVGCVTHFPKQAGPMRLEAFDPDEDEPEAISLSIALDQFVLAYYLPFLRAVETGDDDTGDNTKADAPFTSVSFQRYGLQVAMPSALVRRLRQAENGELEGLYEDVQRLVTDVAGLEGSVFSDGVTITTAWDEELALRDWGQSGEPFPLE